MKVEILPTTKEFLREVYDQGEVYSFPPPDILFHSLRVQNRTRSISVQGRSVKIRDRASHPCCTTGHGTKPADTHTLAEFLEVRWIT